jgi:hypothetical protein
MGCGMAHVARLGAGFCRVVYVAWPCWNLPLIDSFALAVFWVITFNQSCGYVCKSARHELNHMHAHSCGWGLAGCPLEDALLLV